MSAPAAPAPAPPAPAGGRRFLPRLRQALFWTGLAAFTLWVFPAVAWSNLPVALRPVAIALILAAEFWLLRRTRPGPRRTAAFAGLAAVVILAWTCIPASNDRDWQPDVAVVPYAEIRGSRVLVHAVRNCEYRSTSDFDVRLEDRTYDLDHLRTLDFFVVYWSSPSICHTMLSFGFDDGRQLCLSVEARKEKSEGYSAIKGFFRQFELIYILADERDLVRLRTNYRNEQVYLYRLKTDPSEVRGVFLDTMARVNALRAHPEWYNALTHNCTSNLRDRTAPYAKNQKWSWKFLLNGYIDGLVYERGAIDQSLPFEELKKRSLINDRAKAADKDPDFSRLIRKGLPGVDP